MGRRAWLTLNAPDAFKPNSSISSATHCWHLERYPLLAIGEVGQIPLEPEAANVFFHIVAAARNGRLHA